MPSQVSRIDSALIPLLRHLAPPRLLPPPPQDTSIIANIIRCPYPNEGQRAADVLTLLIAGHDTTGYTLAWTLVELSRQPRVLAKMREELDRANPSRGEWSSDQVSGLPYFHAVLKESMRLWPVAANGAGRKTFVDVPLEDGSVIPAGSDILIPFLPLFRSGIANPDDFIPERWVDEGNPDSERLAQLYMPFALGKRNCAGQNLAMLELR
eukprot:CAMPEP_0113726768 /NCGR_PEP_ID=MMETSP0038_2-20120614/40669_1 /TAXON_ID=2898 /ORGANISM="Cryptomonas paramecium" /LENGTH=209 /DNA_ID=CAMNT_0000657519 /DNA_START=411 /DNA_END=1040 /DNA_ORIENTATION=- /assembly_acc=CAM_ASM_000170